MTEFLGLCLTATLVIIVALVQKIMNDRSEHRKTIQLQQFHILSIEQGHLEIEENYENDLLSANETLDSYKENMLALNATNALLCKEVEHLGGSLEMVLNQEMKTT